MNLMKLLIIALILTILNGCGGGGEHAGLSRTLGPSVKSTLYSGDTQSLTYSDESVVTNTATSRPVSWASDHVTQTVTYTFANGGTNAVVNTIPGTESSPVLAAANYPANWASTGTVTEPRVTRSAITYGDGYEASVQDGSSSKPFLQTTLASQASPIADPSAHVSSLTTHYNLTWGTPDKNGPGFAGIFPNASSQLGVITLMGRTVSSYTSLSAGPSVQQPSADVLAAWNAGWTGQGENILMFDAYANISTCYDGLGSSNPCHGLHTMLISGLVAPYASLFGLDSSLTSVAKAGVTGASLTTSNNINVVNISYGFTPCNSGCGGAPTESDFAALTANSSARNANVVTMLNTTTNAYKASNLANAVIVKSAGNAFQDAKYDTTTVALLENASIAARLLVVGTLDRNGSTSNKASADTYIGTSTNYSNFSGTNSALSERFLFAYGRDPYASMSAAFNGTQSQVGQGTSYAAPRVAGYAAILLQKFPNLDAIKTSSIILDTARYDTLACYPNCNSAIWGKGEASLSRALAPVGFLR